MRTKRLELRQWRKEDLQPFAELNGDPRVMAFFPAPLAESESNALAGRLMRGIQERGWGLWAVERLDNREFIGFVGLSEPSFKAPFTPCIEIGWRLKFAAWGCGFATEAARECLRFGFRELKLKEIVSFTATVNTRSISVMKRLGMSHSGADDFDHPKLGSSSPLLRHVLYRIASECFAAG